jgi:hypothetical protein
MTKWQGNGLEAMMFLGAKSSQFFSFQNYDLKFHKGFFNEKKKL